MAWALEIAADDSHGYDQGSREGPDYDCSSFVSWAYYKAGLRTRPGGYSPSTGEIYEVFTAVGFKDVTSQVSFSTGAGLRKGDVLLRPGHHTEMMCDADRMVGAHQNEDGGITGGKTGDQTGDEISVQSYRNKSWVYCLRYPSDPAPPPDTSQPGSRVEVMDGSARAWMYCYGGSPGLGMSRGGEDAHWDFEAFRRLCGG